MPDSIVHILVPLFTLLLIVRKETRILAIMLVPIALFPDIDILYHHRALLHNIFIPSILLILASLIKNKYKQKILLITSFYIFSHIFLDIFYGGVLILYPLLSNTLFIKFDIFLNSNHTLSYIYDIGFENLGSGTFDGMWTKVYVVSTLSFGVVCFASSMYALKRIFIKQT
jgi:hypothetical protein